ncbi:trypsin-like serine peptidase [Sphaerimonospora thailandensis]
MPLPSWGVVAAVLILAAGVPIPVRAQAVPLQTPTPVIRAEGYDIALSHALATSSQAAPVAAFWLKHGGRALLSATPYAPETGITARRALLDGPGPDVKPGLVAAAAAGKAKDAAAAARTEPKSDRSRATEAGSGTRSGTSKNINLPRTIGKAFFIGADGRPHWCSATSVRSDHGDLVATAGHCVYDIRPGSATTLRNWVFIPGYHRGRAPWGIYIGRQAFTHRDFATYGDADRDYAFVSVTDGLAPRRADAGERSEPWPGNGLGFTDTGRLGDRVGGQGLAYNLRIGRPLLIIGHARRSDSLVSSYGRPFAAADPAIKAAGLIGVRPTRTDAVGSPWLAAYRSPRGLGYLNGLTIGFSGTGRTATAVSPYFDGELYTVYDSARRFRAESGNRT